MALTLVNEQADEVVAKLYGDYCRNAASRRRRQGSAEVSRTTISRHPFGLTGESA